MQIPPGHHCSTRPTIFLNDTEIVKSCQFITKTERFSRETPKSRRCHRWVPTHFSMSVGQADAFCFFHWLILHFFFSAKTTYSRSRLLAKLNGGPRKDRQLLWGFFSFLLEKTDLHPTDQLLHSLKLPLGSPSPLPQRGGSSSSPAWCEKPFCL